MHKIKAATRHQRIYITHILIITKSSLTDNEKPHHSRFLYKNLMLFTISVVPISLLLFLFVLSGSKKCPISS